MPEAYRAFPWSPDARAREIGGVAWVARAEQGLGRHDAPERYGAIYLSESPLSSVCEALRRFRYRPLRPEMLRRGGMPLSLCGFRLPAGAELIDLDEPGILVEHGLRPSQIAAGDRPATQATARALHDRHPAAVGLRWWGTLEAEWINWTLFDTRLGDGLEPGRPAVLRVDDPLVREAARLLGMC